MGVVAASKAVFAFLKDGASSDMNVDGSVTPVNFRYTSSGLTELERLNLVILDAGITPTEFGGLNTTLTNGLEVKIFDSGDTELIDFMDGATIQQNSDWAYLAGADTIFVAAAGDDQFSVRWTFSKGTGAGSIRLYDGDYLQIKVQDDLTGLTEMRCTVQGRNPD